MDVRMYGRMDVDMCICSGFSRTVCAGSGDFLTFGSSPAVVWDMISYLTWGASSRGYYEGTLKCIVQL